MKFIDLLIGKFKAKQERKEKNNQINNLGKKIQVASEKQKDIITSEI